MIIKKYEIFKNNLNEEVGFRGLKKISEKYKTCEIFFHQDLDGVASCLCMKGFLEKYYNIKTEDVHIIQYGGMEYAIQEGKPENLNLIVDFAHGKVGYKLFDHHDKQSGAESTSGVYAKPSRSNVEIISGEISYNEIFTQTDIELIKTVDSADFLKHGLTPDDIQNAIFKYDRAKSADKNRFLMGLVVNRLLLVFKNKRITVTSLDGKNNHINKNLLECLVLDSKPSLYSIFNNLKHYINSAISLEWDVRKRNHHTPKKLITPEELASNLADYIQVRQEENEDIVYDEEYKILKEYGIGSVFKTGSYDRYVVFKNFPQADFVCKIFPMGLIQVSGNPFKEKKLKSVNLGEISKEVLSNYKYQFSNIFVPLSDIKRINEDEIEKMKKKYGEEYNAIGFTFNDLKAFYKDSIIYLPNRLKGDSKTRSKLNIDDEDESYVKLVKDCMNKKYSTWTQSEKNEMNWLRISLWDIIIGGSGGHPSITNIQGLNYMSTRKDLLKRLFGTENYTDVMKLIADKFIDVLKSKIDDAKDGDVKYDYSDIKLTGQIVNENFEYYIEIDNDLKSVTKDEFIQAGFDSKFEPLNKDGKGFKIDIDDKKIIGTFK